MIVHKSAARLICAVQIYLDAPHAASGSIPEDVVANFSPPFFEWWNFRKDAEGNLSYVGFEEAETAVKQALISNVGPDSLLISITLTHLFFPYLSAKLLSCAMPPQVWPHEFTSSTSGTRRTYIASVFH